MHICARNNAEDVLVRSKREQVVFAEVVFERCQKLQVRVSVVLDGQNLMQRGHDTL